MPSTKFLLPGAMIFWSLALIYPVAGQQNLPNMDQCVKVDEQNGKVIITNTCDKPFVTQFMTNRNKNPIQKQLKPGESFGANYSPPGWFMGTTCPIGYVSAVPFLPKNKDTIISGKYDCAKK